MEKIWEAICFAFDRDLIWVFVSGIAIGGGLVCSYFKWIYNKVQQNKIQSLEEELEKKTVENTALKKNCENLAEELGKCKDAFWNNRTHQSDMGKKAWKFGEEKK